MNRIVIATAAAVLLGVTCCSGADWLHFRGNNGNGVSDDPSPPKTLDHLAWTADLQGRGISTPVVVGDRVILTTNTGARQEKLHVTCFDKATGKERWDRQFWATGSTLCNGTISMASPSPASDGERVFAIFSSNDVACLDLDGNLLWYRGLTYDYPNAANSLGMASSPVVVNGTLVAQLETDDDSFVIGLDAATGVTRWKNARPRQANWTSPNILRGATSEEDIVLLLGPRGMAALQPKTGKTVWEWAGGGSGIPSSTFVDNVVYIPKSPFAAVQFPGEGQKPKVLWSENRLTAKTASPVVYKGKIYLVNDAGVLVCGETSSGNIAWRLRLKGPFSSSPIVAADRLYLFNQDGVGQIVQLSEKKGDILSTHELKETILGTPAVVDGAVYIRSDKHLWKFVD